MQTGRKASEAPRWRAWVMAAGLMLGCCAAAWASALQPQDGVQVGIAPDAPRALTAAQLAALPQHTTATATPWTDGVAQFSGPLVSDVLKAAQITITKGMVVQAEALNGYVIDIPAEDFVRWPVILAYAMDGKALTRRDKGPLWIVYPRDSDKVLQDAKYDHRWAWQLRQLRVKAQ